MAAYEIKDGVGIIPEGTTVIVDNAFRDCTELTSVVIPDSVTRIGDYAFDHCSGLTSIIIPDSVTEIGTCAFDCCSSLKSLVIANSVIVINEFAFRECRGLTNVVLPDSLIEIKRHAFIHCKGLTSVVIPNSVKKMGISVFYGCSALKKVDIKGKLSSIGSKCFAKCTSLETITFHANIGKIDSEAFEECGVLKTIIVPTNKSDYYKSRLSEALQGLIVEQEMDQGQKCNEKPKQTAKGKNANNSSMMNVSDYNGYVLGLSVYGEATTCQFIIKDGKAAIVEGWGIEGSVDLPQSINAKTKKAFFNKLAIILLKYLCEQFPNDYLSKRIKNDHVAAAVEVFLGEEVWYSDLTSKIAADKIK